MLAVEQDIEAEVHAGSCRDDGEVAMDGVAIGHTPGRKVARDPLVVMEGENRLQPGKSRSGQLWAAGAPGKEVRLDGPGRDAHVSLHPPAVEPDRHVVAVVAAPYKAGSGRGCRGSPPRECDSKDRASRRARQGCSLDGNRHDDHDDVRRFGDTFELLHESIEHGLTRLRSGAVTTATAIR